MTNAWVKQQQKANEKAAEERKKREATYSILVNGGWKKVSKLAAEEYRKKVREQYKGGKLSDLSV